MQVKVKFAKFVDPDIPELYRDFSRSVVDLYEWAITTNSQPGRHIENWTKANVTDIDGIMVGIVKVLGVSKYI